MSLLSAVVGLLGLLVSFGLLCCALERRWSVLIFASLIYGGIAAILIYGAAHSG